MRKEGGEKGMKEVTQKKLENKEGREKGRKEVTQIKMQKTGKG